VWEQGASFYLCTFSMLFIQIERQGIKKIYKDIKIYQLLQILTSMLYE